MNTEYLFGIVYSSYACCKCYSRTITTNLTVTCFKCRGRGWYVVNASCSVFRAMGIYA